MEEDTEFWEEGGRHCSHAAAGGAAPAVGAEEAEKELVLDHWKESSPADTLLSDSEFCLPALRIRFCSKLLSFRHFNVDSGT